MITVTAKMNPEIKSLWVAGLESGDYEQGQGGLCLDGEQPKYCCLGLLCDISKQGTWAPNENRRGALTYITQDGSASRTVLPAAVMQWAGLEHSHPHVLRTQDSEKAVGLAILNDSGMSFKDIAKIIKEQL